MANRPSRVFSEEQLQSCTKTTIPRSPYNCKDVSQAENLISAFIKAYYKSIPGVPKEFHEFLMIQHRSETATCNILPATIRKANLVYNGVIYGPNSRRA